MLVITLLPREAERPLRFDDQTDMRKGIEGLAMPIQRMLRQIRSLTILLPFAI